MGVIYSITNLIESDIVSVLTNAFVALLYFSAGVIMANNGEYEQI